MAQHRCDETIEIVNKEFCDSLESVKSLINDEKYENSTAELSSLFKSAKHTYFTQLHRFPADVVSKKFDDLKRRLFIHVEIVFNVFCDKMQIKAEKVFELDLKSKKDTITASDLESAKTRALVFFRASIEGNAIYLIISCYF